MLCAVVRRAVVVAFLVLAVAPLNAETVRVPADRDTTLIEDPNGALSNGAGPVLFVGRTNQNPGGIRRGLLRFDLASALPAQAIVESVTLHLTAVPGNPGASPVRLYRVLADWGEGTSYSEGGRGAPSEPGDATWIHTFFDQDFWEYAGGQFVGSSSAGFWIDGPGPYIVDAAPKMLADVRHWNAAPGRNFGWILIGDETRPQSAQALATRDNPDPAARPVLEIEYREPGSDGTDR